MKVKLMNYGLAAVGLVVMIIYSRTIDFGKEN